MLFSFFLDALNLNKLNLIDTNDGFERTKWKRNNFRMKLLNFVCRQKRQRNLLAVCLCFEVIFFIFIFVYSMIMAYVSVNGICDEADSKLKRGKRRWMWNQNLGLNVRAQTIGIAKKNSKLEQAQAYCEIKRNEISWKRDSASEFESKNVWKYYTLRVEHGFERGSTWNPRVVVIQTIE